MTICLEGGTALSVVTICVGGGSIGVFWARVSEESRVSLVTEPPNQFDSNSCGIECILVNLFDEFPL